MDKTAPLPDKTQSSLLHSDGRNLRRMAVYLFISLVVHGLFFVLTAFIYHFEFPSPMPKVVQVDLVSFAPGPTGGKTDAFPDPTDVPKESSVPVVVPKSPSIAEQSDIPERSIDPVAVIKPDISLKKKPKNLKDLLAQSEKKNEEREKKKPQKGLTPKPKKKPIPKKNEQLANALERMKKAVDRQGQESSGNGGGRNVGDGLGAGTGMGKKGYDPIELYKTVLKVAIQKNWVFNTAMARVNQDLEVKILLKILKSGEIRDIIYETRSGNQYLDDSAKKAIQRANPLPQLPKGRRSWDVLVIFTPKGLK